MPSRRPIRVAAVSATLALAAALLLAGLPNLAAACGCGALVTPEDAPPAAADEWSIVGFDGREERILMRLDLGAPLDRAALVLPVRPGARVALGEQDAFAEVEALTEPQVEVRRRLRLAFGPPRADEGDTAAGGGSDGAGAPPRVDVIDSRRLGPLDVVTLRSRSADALERWLRRHDFPVPGGLAAATQDYLDDGWDVVVARLAPAERGTQIEALQPLAITFPTRRLVYPLRMSRMAEHGVSARVDLLAPWKADVRGYGEVREETPGAPRLEQGVALVFAGAVGPSDLGAGLTGLADGATHLTTYRFGITPDSPDRDPAFATAGDDAGYRQVVTRTEDMYLPQTGAAAGLAAVGIVTLAAFVW